MSYFGSNVENEFEILRRKGDKKHPTTRKTKQDNEEKEETVENIRLARSDKKTLKKYILNQDEVVDSNISNPCFISMLCEL